MAIDPILAHRARSYSELCGITLDFESLLGEGTDGAVLKTSRDSVVKALYRPRNYSQELECYQPFLDADIKLIEGFNVPKLLGWDDERLIVEMGLVQPPFIVDFAKVNLDAPPDFDDDVLGDAERQCEEIFESRWPAVQSLLMTLRIKFGIYYLDPKPGNIMFDDRPESS